MKTLTQISKEYNIAVSTLATRIRSSQILPVREGRNILINHNQEKQITRPILRQYKGLVNSHVNPSLVWQYKLNSPFLSIEEIAECLAIKSDEVEIILKDDFLVLESKINNSGISQI